MIIKTNILTCLEDKLFRFIEQHGQVLLRVSIGLVYLWFGVVKYFPGLSSAEALAATTICKLSLGLFETGWCMPLLASWECAIGLCFITGKLMRVGFYLMLVHMLGTFTPLFLFPNVTFTHFPLVASLEGQYIIKNLVLVAGALLVGSQDLAARGRAAAIAR